MIPLNLEKKRMEQVSGKIPDWTGDYIINNVKF